MSTFKNIEPSIQGEQLTVEELIELLKKCPPKAKVYHEGCDCWGEADRVEVNEEGTEILIGRN